MVTGGMERLYLASPAWLKDAGATLVGWRNNVVRRGGVFGLHYRVLMENQLSTMSDLKRIQGLELDRLLREVYQYSPYYRRAIDAVTGGAQDVVWDPFELLSRLPILEKSDLRENQADIVSRDRHRKTVVVTKTSGTTGSPMAIDFDSESLEMLFAEWERYYRWMGLPTRFRSVRLSGRVLVSPKRVKPPFWVMNWASRQLFMSTYHLTTGNMHEYVNRLNSFKPSLIDGYPSAVHVLARFINETQAQLSFRPTAISTTAETLHGYQRADIERAFGCPVFNQYASSEGAPWIVQCRKGSYHLWTDTGVFEFMNERISDDGRRVADLVVTSFRARKTPLLRYSIGDTVELAPDAQRCSCGSGFPVVKGIVGRDEDMLRTPERGFVGRLDPAYKGLSGILRSKIVQIAPDAIDVYVVPTDGYSLSTEAQLVHNLLDRLGSVSISVKRVDNIPLSSNGKFKAVENRVPSDRSSGVYPEARSSESDGG